MLRCGRRVKVTATVVGSVIFFWLRAKRNVRYIRLPRSHSGHGYKCTCILLGKEYLRVLELLLVCA